MFTEIQKLLERPPLYAKSTAAFWDDDYISKQMLEAHLDPEFEGASRKLTFIERSVDWIKEMVPPSKYPSLLDLGCGPGVYAERFARAGYVVTGIDFSKRSIEFARDSANMQDLDIEYHCQNYLSLDLHREFDFAAMIYCDYGALPPADRKTVMDRIYHHLKPGGKLLLDVFSMAKYDDFREGRTWELCHGDGFWREEEYLALNGFYHYPDDPNHATLEQICIISHGEAAVYYLWNCYFTKESLLSEAKAAGFKVCDVFSDVAGAPYSQDHSTIAILLEK